MKTPLLSLLLAAGVLLPAHAGIRIYNVSIDANKLVFDVSWDEPLCGGLNFPRDEVKPSENYNLTITANYYPEAALTYVQVLVQNNSTLPGDPWPQLPEGYTIGVFEPLGCFAPGMSWDRGVGLPPGCFNSSVIRQASNLHCEFGPKNCPPNVVAQQGLPGV